MEIFGTATVKKYVILEALCDWISLDQLTSPAATLNLVVALGCMGSQDYFIISEFQKNHSAPRPKIIKRSLVAGSIPSIINIVNSSNETQDIVLEFRVPPIIQLSVIDTDCYPSHYASNLFLLPGGSFSDTFSSLANIYFSRHRWPREAHREHRKLCKLFS